MTIGMDKLLKLNVNSPLELLHDNIFEKHGVNVYVKRDDLIHPEISGNKWRKLKYNIIEAKNKNKNLLISFGGAYSNHIYALAKAGEVFGLETLGIIRGEYDPLNPTIQFAKHCGMKLQFVSRIEYKKRYNIDYLTQLNETYPNSVIIPEGGTNPLALTGFKELIQEIPKEKADFIISPCGSGGTTAGLLAHSYDKQIIISIPVLKDSEYLKHNIIELVGNNKHQLEFFDNYHQGGYGKINKKLLDFIEHFNNKHNILLEPIYSGKMFMAFYDLLEKGHFKPGSSITLLHTGGLQGLNGMKQRGLIPKDWPS